MVRLFLFLLVSIAAFSGASAMETLDRIFDPRFRTLKTSVEDNFMSPPVLRLGTRDRIVVSFDEIGEDNSYLEYRLIHCNADWQPSRLVEAEYVEGFNFGRIEDFAFSSNTFVHYVNYRIELPNEDMGILHSGNYLLQVYDPDEPDTVLLQTRFVATENILPISGSSSPRTDKGFNTEWQQVSLAVNCEGLPQINPYQDLIVDVTQNRRDATRRLITHPLRTEGRMVIYDHLPDLIFPASNEYRRFESISNGFPGMHVDSLRYMGSNYHVWLKPDEERASRSYEYDSTQFGRFLVREYNSTDSDIGADYITVHFSLDAPEIVGADIYIDGEFTHDAFDDNNRMTYDRSSGLYTAQIPVKQGAYNYQYVAVNRDGNAVSPAPVEGNKYETANEYTVAVYYRPVGARADRLLSYTVIR